MGSYESLQLGQPGQVKCPDAFSNENAALLCPGSTRLVLQISKQAVYVQLGIRDTSAVPGSFAGIKWQEPRPYLPIVASLGREFDAVRVRNYTKGQEAQVIISAEAI